MFVTGEQAMSYHQWLRSAVNAGKPCSSQSASLLERLSSFVEAFAAF